MVTISWRMQLLSCFAMLIVSSWFGCASRNAGVEVPSSPSKRERLQKCWETHDSIAAAVPLPGKPDIVLVHSRMGDRDESGRALLNYVLEVVSPRGVSRFAQVCRNRSTRLSVEVFELDGQVYTVLVDDRQAIVYKASGQTRDEALASILAVKDALKVEIGKGELIDVVQGLEDQRIVVVVRERDTSWKTNDRIVAIAKDGTVVWSHDAPYVYDLVRADDSRSIYGQTTEGVVQWDLDTGVRGAFHVKPAIAVSVNPSSESAVRCVAAFIGWPTNSLRGIQADGANVWSRRLQDEGCGEASDVEISSDGTVVAVAGTDGKVDVFDTETGDLIGSVNGPYRSGLMWTRCDETGTNVLVCYSLFSGIASFQLNDTHLPISSGANK